VAAAWASNNRRQPGGVFGELEFPAANVARRRGGARVKRAVRNSESANRRAQILLDRRLDRVFVTV